MPDRMVFFPGFFSRHTSHLLAGLICYSKSSGVELVYGKPDADIKKIQRESSISLVRIENGEQSKLYCFDMADWPELASFSALDLCDVYVKRSFLESINSQVPIGLRQKIVPYGFYFACSQYSMSAEFRAVCNNWLASFRSEMRIMKDSIDLAIRWSARALLKNKPAFIPLSVLESISGGENKVFYHSRVWDPRDHRSFSSKSIEELNANRVALVKALKEGLGDRFLGGITRSDYAEEYCPDLISPFSSDIESYINLMTRAKIVVTEEGLHGSTGSRLGEFFAAGRCIVSERLVYDVPVLPRDGIDWHEFSSPQGCLEKCLSLLDEPAEIDKTMSHARQYYESQSHPKMVVSGLFQ